MENGDDLSPGFFQTTWCENSGLGYLSYQGILALPMPEKNGEYILLHNRQYDFNDSTDLLFTIIDMKSNGGLGKVVTKNNLLQFSAISRTFQAVKHGNGRDWWIIIPRENSDVYYFYLLDPKGIHGPFTQKVSSNWISGQYYNLMCSFSPDGKKFVRLGGDKPAAFRLYDFDRCSGLLSNPVDIAIPDTSVYAAWACFAPNSRFLYLTNEAERLYQYDLEANDINSSVHLIDTYDGYLSVYNLPVGLYGMAIAPDHKIYMSSANGVNILHVIHNPNEPGKLCNWV